MLLKARNIQENEISQSESERLDEELKKLEYIIYKNLATIHTQTESYADALDSQIKVKFQIKRIVYL